MPDQTTSRKRTTAADIAAAVALGAIDGATMMSMAEDSADDDGTTGASGSPITARPTLSTVDHECGIPGCKHGAAHPAVSQPDRQIKLVCPACGAVARMTNAAIARTNGLGIVCNGDSSVFVVAARRTYRKSV